MKLSKLIKDLLIEMAIEGTLPSDMNEFDETLIDNLITEKSIRETAEKHGLKQILSDIPDNMEYNEIMEAIENGEADEKGIEIWEPFEGNEGYYITEQIENATNAGENLIKYFLGLKQD